jgi:hypothetical protein
MISAAGRYARLRLIAARARRPGQPIVAAGPKAKATYITELQAAATRSGARVLAVDLAALLAEVHAASSLEDAQRRVVAKYGRLAPPRALAEVIRKTNLLCHLSGRFDATEEV